jgi:hypothetical protein
MARRVNHGAEMIEPTEADIGRTVLYTRGKAERGVINGFNRDYVFVRYGDGIGAKATLREDLEWELKRNTLEGCRRYEALPGRTGKR